MKIGFGIEFTIPVSSGSVMRDGVQTKAVLNLGGLVEHKIGTTKMTGAIYMRGIWQRAFGVKWLSFGNIHLG